MSFTEPRFYSGNNPLNGDYDPNVPLGWNKWDAEDIEPIEDEDLEDDEE